ncbi:MAG: type II toxin-antitoxin system Phd/YefM family antitoxin [Gemmatimonadaceae bacterium]
MAKSYSLYEAKARLSAIVRQVREGETVVVTVHGKPAVEIRPIAPDPADLATRLADMERRGTLAPAANPEAPLAAGQRKVGALKRFLAERDE